MLFIRLEKMNWNTDNSHKMMHILTLISYSFYLRRSDSIRGIVHPSIDALVSLYVTTNLQSFDYLGFIFRLFPQCIH